MPADPDDEPFEMPTLERLEELTYLLGHGQTLYLRYSPGLSANSLAPPGWWSAPVED
ncbi:MAG TPA: hypothetical protein VNP92_15655 [Actinophytocola sp.]|nr:hypothetical protein [Actinophytocola sp.]